LSVDDDELEAGFRIAEFFSGNKNADLGRCGIHREIMRVRRAS
jgi:hypothetical protein